MPVSDVQQHENIFKQQFEGAGIYFNTDTDKYCIPSLILPFLTSYFLLRVHT